MQRFCLDVPYALRMLRNAPGFSAISILTLALGIGANTAIYSLLDAVLLRTLPVGRPQELERVCMRDWVLAGDKMNTGTQPYFSYPFFSELQRRNRVFSGLLARTPLPATLLSSGRSERAVIELVSGNYFDVLGVRPSLGRLFTDEDDRVRMGHPVAVLGFRYWRTKLSADPAIVGKSIHIDNYPFTVIGVAPAAFFGVEVGSIPDAWVPIAMHPAVFPAGESLFDDSGWRWLDLLGRRSPNITEAQAQAGLNVLWRQLQEEMQKQTSSRGPSGQALILETAGQGLSRLRANFEKPLYVVMTIVALVLLIACANIANLLLVRSAARRKEIAIRLALGAGAGRIVRQLLTESIILSVIGGAVGVVASRAGVRLLLSFLPSAPLPFVLQVNVNAQVLAFSAAATVFAALLFGLAPALQAGRLDLSGSLQEGRAFLSLASRRLPLGEALVVGQVALSLLLLVGAGLFLRSLRNAMAIPVGVDTRNVLMASFDPSLSGYPPTQVANFYRELQARLKDRTGVAAVGTSQIAVLSGQLHTSPMYVSGQPRPAHNRQILENGVGGDFFDAVGIKILRGRNFSPRDTPNTPTVAIINDTAAQYFFGDEDPIGKKVKVGLVGFRETTEAEIIAISSDSKYTSVREDTPRILYYSSDQEPVTVGERTVYVRTDENPNQFIPVLRTETQYLDKDLPMFNVKTFAEQKAESFIQERLTAAISGSFGVFALLLAAMGLYGVMAYAVLRRTREIGIRMALGAGRASVIWMLLRSALAMAFAGMAISIPLSTWLSALVAANMVGVSRGDPGILATACVILTGVAILAASIPAWKASRIEPMRTLRCE